MPNTNAMMVVAMPIAARGITKRRKRPVNVDRFNIDRISNAFKARGQAREKFSRRTIGEDTNNTLCV